MKLGDEIRDLQAKSAPCCDLTLEKVLEMLSRRGSAAGSSAKNKKRGNSKYYSDMAKKRWKN